MGKDVIQKILGLSVLATTFAFFSGNVSAQVPKDGTDNGPDYVTKFYSLLAERDAAIFKIEEDSVKRATVLKNRVIDCEKQIEKEKNELWSMVGAGDAVNIDPDRRLEIYDEQTVKWNERLGTAGRSEFINMRVLGNETAKDKAAVNRTFVRAVYELNGSPDVNTTRKQDLQNPIFGK